ncbi:MAG: glycoside hydrolase family 127 protein, partial [Sphingobacteriaceae bacterium]
AIPSDLYSFQNKETAAVVIKVNGKPVKYTMQNGYAVIGKTWQKNDQITMDLSMPVRRVISNTIVTEDAGKVALQRGPLMYCAEWTDNNGRVSNLVIPKNTVFTPAYHPELLNGLTVLNGQVLKTDSTNKSKAQRVALTAIPYYSWANRGKGEMQVWFEEVGTAVSEEKSKK